MNSPTISIILPVYNCEAYLHRCIGAILGQTEQNLELILVDDGSTDSSGTICDRYAAEDARVRVIHKQNAGVSAARNAGLETAEGAFIAFADGDDWPEPEMYERLLEAQRRAGSDLIYCGFRRVYSDRTEEEAMMNRECRRCSSIMKMSSWAIRWRRWRWSITMSSRQIQ